MQEKRELICIFAACKYMHYEETDIIIIRCRPRTDG
jgi:hypothetical protein